MRIYTFTCKNYNSSEDEFVIDYEVGQIDIDVDRVSACHLATDKTCTIVYVDGVAHELMISLEHFRKIMRSIYLEAPRADNLIMFSQN